MLSAASRMVVQCAATTRSSRTSLSRSGPRSAGGRCPSPCLPGLVAISPVHPGLVAISPGRRGVRPGTRRAGIGFQALEAAGVVDHDLDRGQAFHRQPRRPQRHAAHRRITHGGKQTELRVDDFRGVVRAPRRDMLFTALFVAVDILCPCAPVARARPTAPAPLQFRRPRSAPGAVARDTRQRR